ncbi:MAG TPA: phosphoribosylformylglycinamidine synthase subunit PurS [Thermoanaerobaculia bacterium]|nr:phosphoribosylformylglycinamidine synthase subunit PurS [Thermoanaerobaculia bacterium]
MKVEVRVYPRQDVLDPQGKAIAAALSRLGHRTVKDVRAGKVFFLEVEGSDPAAAERDARLMAEELLANTVIEGYDVKVLPEPA